MRAGSGFLVWSNLGPDWLLDFCFPSKPTFCLRQQILAVKNAFSLMLIRSKVVSGSCPLYVSLCSVETFEIPRVYLGGPSLGVPVLRFRFVNTTRIANRLFFSLIVVLCARSDPTIFRCLASKCDQPQRPTPRVLGFASIQVTVEVGGW